MTPFASADIHGNDALARLEIERRLRRLGTGTALPNQTAKVMRHVRRYLLLAAAEATPQ